MNRSPFAFKRFAIPIALILIVAGAAVIFALTRQPQIPVTGGPASGPIELEHGDNLKEDQSQLKKQPIIIIPPTGNPDSGPIELEPGYNLKEDPSQDKNPFPSNWKLSET